MKSMVFFDTVYRSSHGKAPRGTGSWAFILGRSAFYALKAKNEGKGELSFWENGRELIVWVLGNRKLSEAKRVLATRHEEASPGLVSGAYIAP